MSRPKNDPTAKIAGTIATLVFLLVIAFIEALMPKAGMVTAKEIVPARTTYEYAPSFGDGDGHLVPVHKPTAFRIHIRTDSGWTNHFDVPESIYRAVRIGERFDSNAMQLPESSE